jgi:NitT/TauT family transport system substrate-binding protein
LKKIIFSFITATFLLFSIPIYLFGCASGGGTIKINEVTHSVFYAPMYLADALGYYQDEGFSIELTNGGGADSTMAAVLSGSADVGFCGPEAAIYVAIGDSADAPKVFAQLTKRDGSFIVGRQKDDNFDWSHLAGKEILAGRKGGVPAMTFEYTLSSLNVAATLNYDVAFNMMTSAFESGIADYCTMFEPSASQYQAAGKGYILASVGEQSGEIPYTCFMAKQSYIDKNADKIDGLIRAVTKAVKYIGENTSKDVAEKLAPYFDGTDVSALKTSIDSYKAIDAWVSDMAMTKESFERLQDIIQSCGELEKRVEFTDLVLTERAHAIYQEVYQ